MNNKVTPKNSLAMPSIQEICHEIQKYETFLVSSHIAPDPDAIGSSVAMTLGLLQLGKKATVYLYDQVPERMESFVQGVSVLHQLPSNGVAALMVLDTASQTRVGKDAEEFYKLSSIVFNIDHHFSNDRWGTHAFIDAKAPACALIVLSILRELRVTITPQMANLLYAGLLDDTGSFRFSNTNENAFDCGKDLLSAGASPQEVANALYFSLPHRVIKLRSQVMSGLRLLADGKFSLVVVTKELLERNGAKAEDTEGLVDEARSIEGTCGAALMRELEGSWKISLRSKDERLDVHTLATRFGGGGHRAAAGCRIEGSREQVETTLVQCLEEAIEQISAR